MGSLLRKIREMEEDGTLPQFDPTNYTHVLQRASERGLKTQILFEAMDIIRDNSEMSNETAILEASRRWKIID